MGGLGSGRRGYFNSNDTTTDYRTLDVRRWQRDGLLDPHQSFGCPVTAKSQHLSGYALNLGE